MKKGISCFFAIAFTAVVFTGVLTLFSAGPTASQTHLVNYPGLLLY